MKFHALVLDYDGTIATDGALACEVRAAVAELRGHGVSVLLATERTLADLERAAGDLGFVDAVVAESGAVVAFPSEERVLTLGHEPSPVLLRALRERGIDAVAGQCIIEADAEHAPAILTAMADLDLSLALAVHGSRVTLLPPGISKATGLGEALHLLGRSVHNTVAVGDSALDQAMLEACELGPAVGWGSTTLQAAADAVIEGSGPAAVATSVRRLAALPRLPARRSPRDWLLLGHDAAGQPVTLAIGGRNVLIAGDARAGKSFVAGLLAEQLIRQQYALCVIDPEGDYRTLESLPGVVAVGGQPTPPRLDMIDRLVRHAELSVVIDLCEVEAGERRAYVATLLPHVAAMRRRRGIPHRIVLDEAHYFLQRPEDHALLDLASGAYILVTYRLADLPADVQVATPLRISTRLTDPREVMALLGRGTGTSRFERWTTHLAELPIGEVLMWDADAVREAPTVCRLAHRLTAHVRHRQKYLDVSVAEAHAFIFTEAGIPTGHRARTLGELAGLVRRLPGELVMSHLRRGDYSRWMAEVFGDHVLAARVRAVETRTSADQRNDAGKQVARLIEARYLPGRPAPSPHHQSPVSPRPPTNGADMS